jgi:hypothetical protein
MLMRYMSYAMNELFVYSYRKILDKFDKVMFELSCKEESRWSCKGENSLITALNVRLKNKFLYNPLIKFGKNISKRRADEQILTSPL